MERWRDGVGRPPPPRRCQDYPSFSSTLLDAIYRSIDETDERGATKEQCPGGAPSPVSARKKNTAGISERRRTLPPVICLAVNQPRSKESGCRRYTSSSSDGSSYGSFSSSDHESASAAHPSRLRPIRTSLPSRSANGSNPRISPRIDDSGAKKNRHASIRSRLRHLTDGGSPASPGARLANFLNSLFAAKSKVASVSAGAASPSHSQPCLRKTPGTVKRTVRFCPASAAVADDCRPCGENRIFYRPAAARRAEVEEDDDGGSDSSSDLFELKNLGAIGRFRDELPVYDTTRPGNNAGVSLGVFPKIPAKKLEKGYYKGRV